MSSWIRSRALSRSHPLVSRIRRLSRSARDREREGILLVEGIRLAEEALAERARILEVLASPRLSSDARGSRLLERLADSGVRVRLAGEDLLASLHDAESHQGILLLASRPPGASEDTIAELASEGALLVACGVQDPGNVGALVRIADAAGAGAFVAAGGADPFGPKAVRATAGSVFRLPIARLTETAAVTGLAERLRAAGLRLLGAAPRGGIDYRRADLSAGAVLFLGGEGAGLPEPLEQMLDEKVSIPMSPRVESINVAAAAAVILFAAGTEPPPRRRRPGRAAG